MIQKTSNILPDFKYFVKGNNPKLLIHSGTHGDEFDVIEFVIKAVKKYEDRLPDFVFVPVVSPSAVSLKTRVNNNGSDLNRTFFSESNDLEVKANIEAISNNHFDLFVSFHEDFEFMDYYIYDEGFYSYKTNKVLNHNKKLKELGINLFNGVDDPLLNTEINNGYKKLIVDEDIKNNGMITNWVLSEGIAKDTLTPEIPMKLSSNLKKRLVDTFFEDVLC